MDKIRNDGNTVVTKAKEIIKIKKIDKERYKKLDEHNIVEIYGIYRRIKEYIDKIFE